MAICIQKLNQVDGRYIPLIAQLHKEAFANFFLTKLGDTFLQTLYTGYLEDDNSGIFVAEEKDILVGFVAYSMDYPLFFKKLIRNHLVKFAFCSIEAAIRHPSFILRLMGAWGKSSAVVKSEPYVELASICVDPAQKRGGIGSTLVECLKETVDFSKYAFINLETDADENEEVNSFYKRNGFRLAAQYITREGRRMNEYRYSPYYEERSRMT